MSDAGGDSGAVAGSPLPRGDTSRCYGLALLYGALLPFGPRGLPLGVHLADLVFPVLFVQTWRARNRPRWRSGDHLLAGYLAAMAAAAAWSGGWAPLLEILKAFYGVAIYLTLREVRGLPHRRSLGRALVVSSAVVAAASIVAGVGWLAGVPGSGLLVWPHPTQYGFTLPRLRGPFEVPEMLGDLLTVVAPLALAWSETARGRERRHALAAAAGLAGVGLLTWSHAIAGLGVSLALWAWPGLRRRARVVVLAICVLLLVAVNALSFATIRPAGQSRMRAPFPQHVIAESSILLGGGLWDVEWDHYGALKAVALQDFLDSPWLGVGPGNFNRTATAAEAKGILTKTFRGSDPHCELLGKLAETGLVGGLALVLLWASWVGFARAAKEPFARAAGCGILGILVNGINVDFMNFRFLWLALAMLAPGASSQSPQGARPGLSVSHAKAPGEQ